MLVLICSPATTQQNVKPAEQEGPGPPRFAPSASREPCGKQVGPISRQRNHASKSRRHCAHNQCRTPSRHACGQPIRLHYFSAPAHARRSNRLRYNLLPHGLWRRASRHRLQLFHGGGRFFGSWTAFASNAGSSVESSCFARLLSNRFGRDHGRRLRGDLLCRRLRWLRGSGVVRLISATTDLMLPQRCGGGSTAATI